MTTEACSLIANGPLAKGYWILKRTRPILTKRITKECLSVNRPLFGIPVSLAGLPPFQSPRAVGQERRSPNRRCRPTTETPDRMSVGRNR